MNNISQIISEFERTSARIYDLQATSHGGVYSIFLNNDSSLNPFKPGLSGLIYIGSTSNLSQREFDNHFNSYSTGFSTLRRSLGAILKSELLLTAIPRSPGAYAGSGLQPEPNVSEHVENMLLLKC